MRKQILNSMIVIVIGLILVSSCRTNEAIVAKSGAQLWGENCTRCHYAPSPSDYSDKQWDIVSTHMAVRANLTTIEKNKIINFLKSLKDPEINQSDGRSYL